MLINGNLILGSTILGRNRLRATITYNLTNCTSTNQQATIATNGTYITTIVANTAFSYCGVRVTMGGNDITADSYTMETGVISISHVTGNIVITAEKLSTFANASWYSVKCVAQNNFADALGWAVGDTKSLSIGDYTYTARICDLTENRYKYSNAERYTNMVIETVQLLVDSRQKSSNNSSSNYNNNTIRTYYNETLPTQMDANLSPLLEMVDLPTYYYNNTQGISRNKVFMPSVTELGFGTYENTTVYQYYNLYAGSARVKHKVNNSSNIEWWSRTGSYCYSTISQDYFRGAAGVYIGSDGSSSTIPYHTVTYTTNPNDAMTNSKGIPVFWAW